ncbi:Rieske (2Fe-2S) protein [Paenibacillus sp. SI92]
MKEIIIGSTQDLKDLPAEIQIENRSYWILKDGDSFRLVSGRCPHAGATVECEDGELVCPMHGWTFDLHTGACLNIPGKGLQPIPVVVREGTLIAQL